MSYKRSYKLCEYTLNIYECDKCSTEIDESWPMVIDEEKHFCIECSFKLGFINEIQYCDRIGGISSYMFAAGINTITKEIELTHGKAKDVKISKFKFERVRVNRGKFTWEKNETELRKDARYKIWKKSVFERDNHLCKHCGTNHKIVAHHKTPIKDDVTLVFEVENGITLCASCHPKEHAKMRKG